MGKQVNTINSYPVKVLDKKTAQTFVSQLAQMIDQIPLVDYSEKQILAESKGNRIFYGKWQHSLIVFDQEKPIAVIAGYERKNKSNNQYPQNTLYISELAVDPAYQKQGLGKKLVQAFLDHNQKLGFLHLEGSLNFSIQTNSAPWNNHVQRLYQSFGFTKRTTKKYNNRTDIILGWTP